MPSCIVLRSSAMRDVVLLGFVLCDAILVVLYRPILHDVILRSSTMHDVVLREPSSSQKSLPFAQKILRFRPTKEIFQSNNS